MNIFCRCGKDLEASEIGMRSHIRKELSITETTIHQRITLHHDELTAIEHRHNLRISKLEKELMTFRDRLNIVLPQDKLEPDCCVSWLAIKEFKCFACKETVLYKKVDPAVTRCGCKQADSKRDA
jgi:hypothetical protein